MQNAGADQHGVAQVFVEQQVGDFRGISRCVDALRSGRTALRAQSANAYPLPRGWKL